MRAAKLLLGAGHARALDGASGTGFAAASAGTSASSSGYVRRRSANGASALKLSADISGLTLGSSAQPPQAQPAGVPMVRSDVGVPSQHQR